MKAVSPTIPDGGLAWLVVLGAWGTMVFCNSLNNAYGALLPLVVEYYDTSYATAAWIGGLSDFLLQATSPLATALSHHYGNRRIVIVGVVLVGVGVLASAFVPTAEFLALTYGCITGFGMSLTYGPAAVEVTKNFKKRRAIALSLMYSGTGTATFIIPILVNFLEQEFAFRGCLLILSGYTLQSLVFGALLRDWRFSEAQFKLHVNVENQDKLTRTETCETNLPNIESDQLDKDHHKVLGDKNNCNSISKFAVPIIAQGVKVHPLQNKSLEDTNDNYIIDNKFDIETPSKGCKWLECHVVGKLCFRCNATDERLAFFDCSLLRNKLGLLYLTIIALGFSTDVVCYNVLVSHAEDNGVEKGKAQTMLSVAGGVNMLARILTGWFVDKKIVSGKIVYAVLTICGGCCAIALGSVKSQTVLWLCSVLIGIFVRATPPIQVIILADVFGLEKLHSSFGLAGFFRAVSGITFPYAIGLLRDFAGTWTPGLYISGSTAVIAGVIVAVEAAVHRKCKRNLTEDVQ